MSSKKFLSALLLGLSLTGTSLALASESPRCGFPIQNYKISHFSENQVPLYVDRAQFRPETFAFFRKAQGRAYSRFKNSIEIGPQKCPKDYKRAEKVLKRLLQSSKLHQFDEKSEALIPVVLCSKAGMPPISKILAGKYILIPSSLTQESVSEASMAAVLAHEIAHFTLSHHARLFEELNFTTSSEPRAARAQKIKSEHEKEADLVGLQLLENAGYKASHSLDHLKAVEAEVISRLSKNNKRRKLKKRPTHQSYEDRLVFLSQQIERCGYSVL